MEDELLKYLYDIREAASAILRFVRGKTFDEYEQDELLRSGVERKLEILGEALNRIRKDDPALLGKIREHRIVQEYPRTWLRQHRPHDRMGHHRRRLGQTARRCRKID